MNDVRKFIEWLSFCPTSDDIARVLATDYLSDHGISAIRFGRINSDDSAIALGQYGHPDADQWRHLQVPGVEWRSWTLPEIEIITGKNKDKWTPDSLICVLRLRDRGVMQGHAVFTFSQAVAESSKASVIECLEDFCVPISLFLSFQNRTFPINTLELKNGSDSRDTGAAPLTQRQILILQGMVEGKTNHELAADLGFSVSTIRHETMRIYQALSVSDRKEAAKKALALSLI